MSAAQGAGLRMPAGELAVAVCVLALVATFNENLRIFLDIQITSWTLRRQGVASEEIHKIAIAKARRERRNLVVQVLTLLIRLAKK